MKLRGTSQEIDQIQTDALVLSFFEDERPLKGSTGLTDWYMCGRLSKLIMSDFISGRFGEPLLMPAKRGMPFSKVLVMGLGKQAEFSVERFEYVIRQVCETLIKMNVNQFSLALPGVETSALDPAEAAEILGKVIPECFQGNPELLTDLEVTVITHRGSLKSINPVLARLERTLTKRVGK